MIKRKIIELLSSFDLSTRMGINGRKFASEKFSYESIVQQWKNLFDQIKDDNSLQPIVDDLIHETFLNRIRESLRRIKKRYPVLKVIPSSLYFLHTIQFVKLKIEKITY